MRYKLKGGSKVLAKGRAIGQKIGTGPVRIIRDPSEMDRVRPGDVLVADMTDPNWEPVMKRASAIVTNQGSYLSCGDYCSGIECASRSGLWRCYRTVARRYGGDSLVC